MLKKILIGTLTLIVVLFGLLVWHIQAVTSKPPGHNDNMQLALIRFDTPLDSTEAMQLRSEVRAMKGVGHCYVNVPEGALTYSYDRAHQSRGTVFAKVASLSSVPCNEVIVSPSDTKGSCPVVNTDSTTGKLSSWIAGWFH